MEKIWLKSYDSPVPPTLDYPQKPLHHFVEEAAQKYSDSLSLIFQPAHQGFAVSRMTYRQLDDLSNQLAAALYDLGVRKGDRVVIYMPNSPQFVIAYYAILKAGGVVVATNPLYSPREMEHQFNDCGAELVLVMSNFYEQVKQVQPKTQVKQVVVTNIKEYMPWLLRLLFSLTKEKKEGHAVTLQPGDFWLQDLIGKYQPGDRPQVEVGPDDLALFQYTGGTTGVSKGAVALHRNIVADTLAIKAWMHDTREAQEVVLAVIPLFHVYGMVAAMNYAMSSSASLVLIPNPRDIDNLLVAINRHRPTIFPGVPTMYNAINNHPDVAAGKYDLTSIRACISGSAPLLLEIKNKFEALTGAALREGFGLSEAPTATHCNPISGENREGSIGLPLPDVEAAIVDLDTGTQFLEVGEVGELVVYGPMVMQGYWQMPTETENVLRVGPDGRPGWLYTGDIARLDQDGYFYIVDRKKEMIIAGGFNIYPREVEEVLAEHPKIKEVSVAGVPDPHRGETVKAWIVLHEGETATEEEIVEWSKEQLAKYKYPRMVEFRDELPKTMVGKVLRRVLVEEEKRRMAEGQ